MSRFAMLMAGVMAVAAAPVAGAADAPVVYPSPVGPQSDLVPSKASPPRIVTGSCGRPEYPLASLADRESGVTQVNVAVNEKGQVTSTIVAATSGFKRLDAAARFAFMLCEFRPARDAQGFPVPDVAILRHTWRPQDAAEDPWVQLRAASKQGPWPATDNLALVTFESPSITSTKQRSTIFRRMREAATEHAQCASLENITVEAAPALADGPDRIDPKTGEIRVATEVWHATQCGMRMTYLLALRFPEGAPANFVMVPVKPPPAAEGAPPAPPPPAAALPRQPGVKPLAPPSGTAAKPAQAKRSPPLK